MSSPAPCAVRQPVNALERTIAATNAVNIRFICPSFDYLPELFQRVVMTRIRCAEAQVDAMGNFPRMEMPGAFTRPLIFEPASDWLELPGRRLLQFL